LKFKATKKQMRDNYNTIISIGYCDAQYLLHFENEIAYSTRTEGWACDYYDIDGVLISTGYAPLSDRNTKKDYHTIRHYEEQARDIVGNYSIPYEEQKTQVKALLNDFPGVNLAWVGLFHTAAHPFVVLFALPLVSILS
jgi:hypothetical protein